MRFEHPIRQAAPRARVDRGGALYLGAAPLPGFDAEARGALYALTPGTALIDAFAHWARQRAAGDTLAASLSGLQGGKEDGMPLLLEGIKLLELPAAEGALWAYEKRVRQSAAVCLRQRSGGGLLAMCAMCLAIARKGLTKQ